MCINMFMKFKAKIWRTGDSHVVTIPSDYIKNSDLLVGESYTVEVTEDG